MGARKQLTFFTEPVSNATFEPLKGDYILFVKDVGGNEFGQLYRFDFSNGALTLLSDGGRSQNGGVLWSNSGRKIGYSSTRRNGADRDIYLMNPLDKATDKLLLEVSGGGWGVLDWSPDEVSLSVVPGSEGTGKASILPQIKEMSSAGLPTCSCLPKK
jgi:Tol biopolymer transport system component